MKRRSYKKAPTKNNKLFKGRLAKKKPKSKVKASSTLVHPARKEGLSLGFFTISAFLFVCLGSELLSFSPTDLYAEQKNVLGFLGKTVSEYLVLRLGASSFVLPVMCLLSSVFFWSENINLSEKNYTLVFLFISYCLFIISAAALVTVIGGEFYGGSIGIVVSNFQLKFLGNFGSIFLNLIASIFFAGVVLGVGGISILSYILSTFYSLSSRFFKFIRVHVPIALEVFTQVVRSIFSKFLDLFLDLVYYPLKEVSFSRGDKVELNSPKDSKSQGVISFLSKLKTKAITAFDKATGDQLNIDSYEEDVVVNQPKLATSKEVIQSQEVPESETLHIPIKINDLKVDTEDDFDINSQNQSGNYLPPDLEIFKDGLTDPKKGPSQDELLENCKLLERTLADFKVSGKVVEVQPGPVITLYEFAPAAGVKVQKVIGLADDLALTLKVPSLRAYAPVPGKGTIGLEVPNAFRQMVRIRDVVSSKSFSSYKENDPLPLALGKDTFGEAFVADLATMPHLLIAGATGTGKSVCINSLLVSLLYNNSADKLKLVLIDPKMLELSVYESIPQLASPVITNPKRAKASLMWAVNEMDRRYALMQKFGVRSLAAYNEEVGSLDDIDPKTGLPKTIDPEQAGPIEVLKPLPRVVIVIDELADLMLTVGKEIEELLTRLAQKARAAGIHMILATQRPSVNVITGLIKANFPARISFQVTSKIDSRTILDQSGAEKLLGKGDMLYMAPGVGKVKRIHGSYITDAEVGRFVKHVKSQGKAQYDSRIEEVAKEVENADNPEFESAEDRDELYDNAVELVIKKGHASTSMIQRAFRIGYNRAARILDSMQANGIVGPADGARPREILVKKDELD